jgi:hypothetical protein
MSGKCENCDNELVKRATESNYDFKGRKYCCQACAKEGMRKKGHWRHDIYLGRVPDTRGLSAWKQLS